LHFVATESLQHAGSFIIYVGAVTVAQLQCYQNF